MGLASVADFSAGISGMIGFKPASTGRGFLANEKHRIRPVRLRGGFAAIDMATGPENDLPSKTKEVLVGKRLRA